MTMLLIVNTVLCVLGILPAFGLQLASVMGGANSGTWIGSVVATMGLILPAMPIVSIIGSWISYKFGPTWLTIGFVALPWAYLLVLLLATALLFMS